MRQKFFAHSDPIVLTAKFINDLISLNLLLLTPDTDTAARLREFHGIVCNCCQKSCSINRISQKTEERKIRSLPVHRIGNIFLFRLDLRLPVDRAKKLREIKGGIRNFRFFGFQLTHRQNIINQRKKVSGRPKHLISAFLLKLHVTRILICDFNHPHNSVQRCPEIMAHIAQCAGLQRIFLFCL